MPTCHVYVAASLDGYIARPDGDVEWLHQWPDTGHDYGYGDFVNSVDGLIIGRGTFENVLSFGKWPYEKPVVVLSSSLDPGAIPPDRADRVRIVDLTPEKVLELLDGEGWSRAYIDGGRIIQSFLRAGLVADMTITHVPILLGAGRPLFGALPHDVGLTHIETTAYPSGFVQSHYVIGRVW